MVTFPDTGEVDMEEDDVPKLPSDTLAALQEFYSDRESRETRFQDLKSEIEQEQSQAQLTMDMFSEDWNASQFWYSDETATFLAKQLLDEADSSTNICIVSAPSVFVQLKNILASSTQECPSICLLEFDDRFDVFPEFIHYDYQHPLALPSEMKGIYDRILCDPPFLSADCQTKAAMTVRWLSRPASITLNSIGTRIIVCTGQTMEDLVLKIYPGTFTTNFDPQHNKNRLSNDFRCYANFKNDGWSQRAGTIG